MQRPFDKWPVSWSLITMNTPPRHPRSIIITPRRQFSPVARVYGSAATLTPRMRFRTAACKNCSSNILIPRKRFRIIDSVYRSLDALTQKRRFCTIARAYRRTSSAFPTSPSEDLLVRTFWRRRMCLPVMMRTLKRGWCTVTLKRRAIKREKRRVNGGRIKIK